MRIKWPRVLKMRGVARVDYAHFNACSLWEGNKDDKDDRISRQSKKVRESDPCLEAGSLSPVKNEVWQKRSDKLQQKILLDIEQAPPTLLN